MEKARGLMSINIFLESTGIITVEKQTSSYIVPQLNILLNTFVTQNGLA